jgi:hypothetical protein
MKLETTRTDMTANQITQTDANPVESGSERSSGECAFTKLMKDAALKVVEVTMVVCGKLPPSLVTATSSGDAIFSRDDLSNAGKMQEFVTTGRMICIAENVDAVVVCVSAWIRTEGNSQVIEPVLADGVRGAGQEVVMLFGESRDKMGWAVYSVERHGNGHFRGFEEGPDIRNAKVNWEFFGFMPTEVPDDISRRKAKEYLAARNLPNPRTSQERGLYYY